MDEIDPSVWDFKTRIAQLFLGRIKADEARGWRATVAEECQVRSAAAAQVDDNARR